MGNVSLFYKSKPHPYEKKHSLLAYVLACKNNFIIVNKFLLSKYCSNYWRDIMRSIYDYPPKKRKNIF